MAFAVVDFETTGILPSYHHRVVEIGVTHVEDDGSVTGSTAEPLPCARKPSVRQRGMGAR